MPRRRITSDRVVGPAWIKSRKRWRVMVITEGQGEGDRERTTRWFSDEALAEECRDEIAKGLALLINLTVEDAIKAYEQHFREAGTIGYGETLRRLRLFFPDLHLPVSRVTPERAADYYSTFRQRERPDGKPISVSYHRAALINARSFFKFCVKQGWSKLNPFADVEGVGRRNAGKAQLTGDEAARLVVYCLELTDGGDHSALGVLMALSMALRSGDLCRRVVRDVDMKGTVLRVTGGKTKKSNRPRRIPVRLRPLVLKLAEGRGPLEALFFSPWSQDGHHTRRWLEQAMERHCEAAGVPYVCPHSLKSTAGNVLADDGVAGDVIMQHLSHEKKDTTERHYVERGAVEEAQAGRLFSVLTGGKR